MVRWIALDTAAIDTLSTIALSIGGAAPAYIFLRVHPVIGQVTDGGVGITARIG